MYADGPSSLMARGKASKAKATPARQGSLGVSRHPHIKKPSQLIGRQIAAPALDAIVEHSNQYVRVLCIGNLQRERENLDEKVEIMR